MKPTKITSSHNHFCGAVWAAVHCAQKTRNNCYRVVQMTGQKRWSVVNKHYCQTTRRKAAFTVNSYRSHADHVQACDQAGNAIKKWRTALYREFVSLGNAKCIPRRMGNHTHEQFLKMAARKNNAAAIMLLITAGADVNHNAGMALRMAVHRNHQASVIALLNAGASVQTTRDLLFAPQIYGTARRWMALLVGLVTLIKDAGLNENLPVFDELAQIAHEPACRPVIIELASNYPKLLAKLV